MLRIRRMYLYGVFVIVAMFGAFSLPAAPLAAASCPQLSVYLQLGTTHQDVITLKQFLQSEGLLGGTQNTTYFGTATEAALKQWQTKKGIEPTGTAGPKTRAALANCNGTTITPPVVSSGTNACPLITTTLARGSRHPEVRTLQTYFVSQNLLTPDSATGFFGALTERAVQTFQRANNLEAVGFTGVRTRAALKNCSTVTVSTNATTKPITTPVQQAAPSSAGSSASGSSYTNSNTNSNTSSNVSTQSPPITYAWQTGAWSTCTNGSQTRTVSCLSSQNQTVADSYCTQSKPTASQSCTVSTTQPQSCTFNGQTIAHGASVTAYQSSSVSAGQSCVSEVRTCANGQLNGSYTNASCTALTVATCSRAEALKNSGTDSSTELQACVDSLSKGMTLELDPGQYALGKPLHIGVGITLRTKGVTASETRSCQSISCAVLKALPVSNTMSDAFVKVTANETVLDHVVIDGNKAERASLASANACNAKSVLMSCKDCGIKNSIIQNSVCVGAVNWVGPGYSTETWSSKTHTSNITFTNNFVLNNGDRNSGYFSDGLALFDADTAVITDNTFLNNTDISLVIGGCQNCTISRNTFKQTVLSAVNHAAIALSPWPNTFYLSNASNQIYTVPSYVHSSGDFSGTKVTSNSIDCTLATPNVFNNQNYYRDCGMGILVGSNPWYYQPNTPDIVTFGNQNTEVSSNTIVNARVGLAVDTAYGFSFSRNTITNTDSLVYGRSLSPFFPKLGAIYPGNGYPVIDAPYECPSLNPENTYIITSQASMSGSGTYGSSHFSENSPVNPYVYSQRGCILGDN